MNFEIAPKEIEIQANWDDAKLYCFSLTIDGKVGWRLPTKDELNQIYLKIMEHPLIATDNYVAFTFFIGTMAMMAASVFFFFELNNTPQKWRTSVLVSGLITFIAAVHYYYMRGYNLETGDSPTFFRYVDWILTVPLMCVEFYLIKIGRAHV